MSFPLEYGEHMGRWHGNTSQCGVLGKQCFSFHRESSEFFKVCILQHCKLTKSNKMVGFSWLESNFMTPFVTFFYSCFFFYKEMPRKGINLQIDGAWSWWLGEHKVGPQNDLVIVVYPGQESGGNCKFHFDDILLMLVPDIKRFQWAFSRAQHFTTSFSGSKFQPLAWHHFAHLPAYVVVKTSMFY